MNRSFLIVIVVAIASVGLLYSLPKVVVNSQARKLADDGKTSSEKTDSSTRSTAAAAVHTTELTAEQKRESSRLTSKYTASVSQNDKIKWANQLSEWYSKVKRFDSAAKYAEVVALLAPTELNTLAAGNRYYDAYGFALDEKRTNELGQKTREWYQKALDKNPNLMAAKANMAMTYVSTPNPMQGILLLREVLNADPTNELALFNLGMLSMRSNQYQKAADRFAQILKINPQNTKVRFYLGVSLAQLGKAKEALEQLATVKKTEQDPTIQAAIRELEQDLK